MDDIEEIYQEAYTLGFKKGYAKCMLDFKKFSEYDDIPTSKDSNSPEVINLVILKDPSFKLPYK